MGPPGLDSGAGEISGTRSFGRVAGFERSVTRSIREPAAAWGPLLRTARSNPCVLHDGHPWPIDAPRKGSPRIARLRVGVALPTLDIRIAVTRSRALFIERHRRDGREDLFPGASMSQGRLSCSTHPWTAARETPTPAGAPPDSRRQGPKTFGRSGQLWYKARPFLATLVS